MCLKVKYIPTSIKYLSIIPTQRVANVHTAFMVTQLRTATIIYLDATIFLINHETLAAHDIPNSNDSAYDMISKLLIQSQ